MLPRNADLAEKERRIRKKALLRVFREDQQARMWNKAMDEVGSYELTLLDAEYDSFEFENSAPEPENEFSDGDYGNKAETLHNIFECD